MAHVIFKVITCSLTTYMVCMCMHIRLIYIHYMYVRTYVKVVWFVVKTQKVIGTLKGDKGRAGFGTNCLYEHKLKMI